MLYQKLNNTIPMGDGIWCLPSSWSWTEPSFSSPPPCSIMKSCKGSSCGDAWNQKSFFVCWCCFGLELLVTNLADKHIAIVLPNNVHVRCSQRLESLVTYITGVNPLFLVCFVPKNDPIQQQHEFLHTPALNIFRSGCQQMSTSLHVLLKAYPSLECNVADAKADPCACHQLGQVSVLQ